MSEIKEIVGKINKKLEKSGWYEKMRLYLISEEFSGIVEKLKKFVDEDKRRFTPQLSIAFKWMELCPVDKIKAVILVDYVCPFIGYTDGIPMSLPVEHKEDGTVVKKTPSPILKDIFVSLNQKGDYHHTSDLSHWCQQGVLIIPMAVTSEVDKKPMYKLWQPFLMRIIEAVNEHNPSVPWFLIGEKTFLYEDEIKSKYLRKAISWPKFEDVQWHEWINSILKSQKKKDIKW